MIVFECKLNLRKFVCVMANTPFVLRIFLIRILVLLICVVRIKKKPLSLLLVDFDTFAYTLLTVSSFLLSPRVFE